MTRSRSTPTRSRPVQSPPQTIDLQGVTTLEELSARFGPATEAEVLQLVGPVEDSALVAEGAQHATRRIADDVFRLIVRVHGWFTDATVSEGDRRAVRYHPDNLRVLAWAAAQDVALARKLAPNVGRGARGAESKLAAARLGAARATREQLAEALLGVVGARSTTAVRVNAARRPGVSNAVDESLDALVAIGREQLASRDADVIARARSRNVDAAWLDACAALAREAATARALFDKPGALAVTQTQLDRWDGLVLLLLDGLTRAFNRANAVNVHVPRLAYVSLRRRADRAQPAADPADKPTG